MKETEKEKWLEAQVECLRKVLAEKDKEIKHLKDLLAIYDKNQWDWDENKVKVTYEKETQNA